MVLHGRSAYAAPPQFALLRSLVTQQKLEKSMKKRLDIYTYSALLFLLVAALSTVAFMGLHQVAG